MALNRTAWRATRARLQDLLLSNSPNTALSGNKQLQAAALIPLSLVTMHLPCNIGDYTDFYSSRDHATNIGTLFRGKDNALQPNWLHLPVGYHGRASSVVVSGTDVVRPQGQLQKDATNDKAGSVLAPCKLMDFELEMAFFVGGEENPLGEPIKMEDADERIFGCVLMNDWSARDIQKWEYVPLGPFTAKNFATSISPWVLSMDALEPYRCASSSGTAQTDPVPLDYITDPSYSTGQYDVTLEIAIQGKDDDEKSIVSVSNLKHMYWNFKQQLVHHSVTGCNMRAGDLLATGTISGPDEGSMGSMLERD
jgi:fumarylacetoacetase